MVDWDKFVIGPTIQVFGEPVTYQPTGGSAFVVSGIFDEAYREVDLAGGMAATTEVPVLGVRMADFPTPPQQDDTLVIQRLNATYAVREVRLDGHGGAKLMLNFLGG